MTQKLRIGGSLTAVWAIRLRVSWALLVALLIVMGVATPGPTVARPATEYNVRGQFTATSIAPPSLRIVALQQTCDHGREIFAFAVVPAIFIKGDHNPVWTVVEPIYGFKASSRPQDVLRHDYDATGPPTTDLSKPV